MAEVITELLQTLKVFKSNGENLRKHINFPKINLLNPVQLPSKL